MHNVLLRQPMLCTLLLLMGVFFGLAIYDAYRTPPAARLADPFTRRQYTPQEAEEDGLSLFMQAVSAINTDYLVTTPPQYETPPEQAATQHYEYVARHTNALALIREGVQQPYFDRYRRTWPSPSARYAPVMEQRQSTILNVLGAFRRGDQYYRNDYSTRRISALLAYLMEDAMARRDETAWVEYFELAMQVVSRHWNHNVHPELMLGNTAHALDALASLEHAMNCLDFSIPQCYQLRNVLAEHLLDKSIHVSRAFQTHYDYAMAQLAETRKYSHVPPWGNGVLDRTFALIGDTWLSRAPGQRVHYLYHLRQIINLARYQHYGGEETFLPTSNPLASALYLRAYAHGAQGWGVLTARTIARGVLDTKGYYGGKQRAYSLPPVFSAEARRMADDRQVLWPYMQDYEPYVEILALARGADTALAALAYYHEHDMLPERVEDLIPDYLEKPHQDPYAWDAALRHLRNERAFVIRTAPIPYDIVRYRAKPVTFTLLDPGLRHAWDVCESWPTEQMERRNR